MISFKHFYNLIWENNNQRAGQGGVGTYKNLKLTDPEKLKTILNAHKDAYANNWNTNLFLSRYFPEQLNLRNTTGWLRDFIQTAIKDGVTGLNQFKNLRTTTNRPTDALLSRKRLAGDTCYMIAKNEGDLDKIYNIYKDAVDRRESATYLVNKLRSDKTNLSSKFQQALKKVTTRPHLFWLAFVTNAKKNSDDTRDWSTLDDTVVASKPNQYRNREDLEKNYKNRNKGPGWLFYQCRNNGLLDDINKIYQYDKDIPGRTTRDFFENLINKIPEFKKLYDKCTVGTVERPDSIWHEFVIEAEHNKLPYKWETFVYRNKATELKGINSRNIRRDIEEEIAKRLHSDGTDFSKFKYKLLNREREFEALKPYYNKFNGKDINIFSLPFEYAFEKYLHNIIPQSHLNVYAVEKKQSTKWVLNQAKEFTKKAKTSVFLPVQKNKTGTFKIASKPTTTDISNKSIQRWANINTNTITKEIPDFQIIDLDYVSSFRPDSVKDIEFFWNKLTPGGVMLITFTHQDRKLNKVLDDIKQKYINKGMLEEDIEKIIDEYTTETKFSWSSRDAYNPGNEELLEFGVPRTDKTENSISAINYMADRISYDIVSQLPVYVNMYRGGEYSNNEADDFRNTIMFRLAYIKP